MQTIEWQEIELDVEPAATMSVDWIEDDLERTPVAEIELIDEADVFAAPCKRQRANG